ncbi:hypothetical protein AN478_10405 [Thiohalorhabdus denitrificans]|uniref:hypothetical protein n=1 Tax=Thiohalorhabdus denitrificans TaxID=381306 RepID=UPI0006D555E0|nr:hypothetical protein [Thiohalorhabdus denitrificans]KPV39550.1 hypothetical protein AN478_10405 [Thiohalorhabdus denitrificans]
MGSVIFLSLIYLAIIIAMIWQGFKGVMQIVGSDELERKQGVKRIAISVTAGIAAMIVIQIVIGGMLFSSATSTVGY